MSLHPSKALVTGASTGIGREIAKILAENGSIVGLVARSKDGLEETQRIIEHNKGKAHVFPADLRLGSEIDRLIIDVQTSLGTINVLVHAAGVWHDSQNVYAGIPLVDTPKEQISSVLDVGIRAPMLLTRGLLPDMIRSKWGKIICISGTFASGGAGWLHYYVSKLALEHFTVGLAQELREHEIQVNCISPSDTDTDALRRFFPDDAKTALPPIEVAKLALFLASSDSDNITGQCIVVKNRKTH